METRRTGRGRSGKDPNDLEEPAGGRADDRRRIVEIVDRRPFPQELGIGHDFEIGSPPFAGFFLDDTAHLFVGSREHGAADHHHVKAAGGGQAFADVFGHVIDAAEIEVAVLVVGSAHADDLDIGIRNGVPVIARGMDPASQASFIISRSSR